MEGESWDGSGSLTAAGDVTPPDRKHLCPVISSTSFYDSTARFLSTDCKRVKGAWAGAEAGVTGG